MSILALVTGSSGFIGSGIVEALGKESDHDVYGIARHLISKEKCKKLKTIEEVFQLKKLNDYQAINIYHCAAFSSYRLKDRQQIAGSIDFSREILKMFKKLQKINSETYLIHTSTIGVLEVKKHIEQIKDDNKAISSYVCSKKIIEGIFENENQAINLRLGWIYGEAMRLDSHIAWIVDEAIRGKMWTKLNWPGVINPLHIDDLIRIIKHIMQDLTRKNNKYRYEKSIITSINHITIGELISIAKDEKIRLKNKKNKIINITQAKILPKLLKGLIGNFYFHEPSIAIKELALEKNEILSYMQDFVRKKRKKNILITGGSSGLGLELLHLHMGIGDDVTVIDKKPLDPMVISNVKFIGTDLSIPFDTSSDFFSNFDVIYLNAGFASKEEFKDKDISRIQSEMQINIINNVCFIQNILRLRNKKIVVISSSSIYFATPGMELYSAAKCFLSKLSLDLMNLAKKDNNTIHLYEVSGMNTNFQNSAGVKMHEAKLLSPKYVADKIVRNIKYDKSIYQIIGKTGKILKLSNRILPTIMQSKITSIIFDKFR